MTSLIGTDEFIRSIIERAGLTDLVNGGLLTVDGVRASIGTAADSANTLRVSGLRAPTRKLRSDWRRRSIDSFIQWVIDASLSDSATAEKFLQCARRNIQDRRANDQSRRRTSSSRPTRNRRRDSVR